MSQATCELRVLNETGDLKVSWDPSKPIEVEAARKQFEDLKKKNYVAYALTKSNKKGKAITEFDPSAEKIVLTPMLQGG